METDKKIFAEYHNPRYTRELDGKTGNWAYTNESKDSKAAVRRYNYNADLIDGRGRNCIASVNYPIVGMQSQNDADYIEYQILLAKLAYIDGFMTDFRHLDDEDGIKQLELLRRVARRYDFEIGVDWCDAQIFYSLKKVRPDLDTREKQIDYCRRMFKYLTEEVYADKTGANIGGNPVVLLFGDGFRFEEYRKLAKDAASHSDRQPWYFRRAMMNCDYDGKTVAYSFDVNHEYFTEEHRGEIAGAFGWVPFRLRDAVADGKPYWDIYATEADCIAYLRELNAHARENRDKYKALISVVTPGMDHRGCAAWGRALSYIERRHGEIYRAMWEYNVRHRGETDAVFIASWNDFNEGHEIEPTVENGYRELELTARYGTRFKGVERESDFGGFLLPEQLFALRKRAKRLKDMGYSVLEIQKSLDEAALLIAARRCGEADKSIRRAEKKAADLYGGVRCVRVSVPKFETVRQSERVNIAGRANVKVSGELAGCEGVRAIDGEKARSFWRSAEGGASIELSWESERKIEEIKLFTGWVERSDKPNWPMVPEQLTVKCGTPENMETVWHSDCNKQRDIKILCGKIANCLRIESSDAAGLVIRDIEVTERTRLTEGAVCYDGAEFKMPSEQAERICKSVFDGYLTFEYLDEGFGSFEVRSEGKFPTICSITTDNTKKWRQAKVRLYGSNTAWDKQPNLLFRGNVTVRNIAAEFDIYEKA